MHNNRNNRETVIIPQTIIVPTKSIIVASLKRGSEVTKGGDAVAQRKMQLLNNLLMAEC